MRTAINGLVRRYLGRSKRRVSPRRVADGLMASLPLIVAFIVFQRRLIEGIAFTGLKG